MARNRDKRLHAILVVEDETLLRLYAAVLLEEAGFKVFEAKNAADALRVLEERSDVEILFTDIQMPGQFDGLALAHAVRYRWPRIKVLITSGEKRPRDEDMPEDGRFISKPFVPSEIINEVNSLIA